MDDDFAIVEEPVPIPEEALKLDLLTNIRERIVSYNKLANSLENERIEAQRSQRKLLLGLLDVADALDRIIQQPQPASDPEHAFERLQRNIELTRKLLSQRLARGGVTPLDLVGKIFDSALADIADYEDDPSHPDATVLREEVKGYRWNDDILRRASVIVSRIA